jgi:aspartate kinase
MEETSARFCLVSSIQNKSKLNTEFSISFSVCVEDKFDNFKALNAILSKFKVEFDENVTLYTIRHFENAAQTVEENKVVLLKQVSRETMQVVTKKFSILFSTS